MNIVDNNSKYFQCNAELSGEALIQQLRIDLADTIERIHDAAEKTNFCQSHGFLQSTRNSLRRSVEQIQLEENQPLFKRDGQCRGASEWFIALFFNFKKKYPEIPTPKLLIEIAKQFNEGVGIQGAFLQKSYEKNSEHQTILHSLNFDLEEIFQWDLTNKDASLEIFKKVYELEEGTYLLSFSGYTSYNEVETESVPGHATVVIIENGYYYFFDINDGLVGTGHETGIEDKMNEVGLILTMCKQYSPFDRAEVLYQKGLKSLSQVLNPVALRIIQEMAPQYKQEGKAYLSAPVVYGFIKGLKRRGKISSEKEEDEIFGSICYKPAMLQLKLELSEAIRLRKCIFLG